MMQRPPAGRRKDLKDTGVFLTAGNPSVNGSKHKNTVDETVLCLCLAAHKEGLFCFRDNRYRIAGTNASGVASSVEHSAVCISSRIPLTQ